MIFWEQFHPKTTIPWSNLNDIFAVEMNNQMHRAQFVVDVKVQIEKTHFFI